MPSIELPRRAVLRSALVGSTVSLAGCSSLTGSHTAQPLPEASHGAEDWPAAGFDARNTRHNAGARPPRSQPTPRWSTAFRACYPPLVRGTRVVLNAENRLIGLRAIDGEEVWRSSSEPWGFERPTLGADRAYVTGTDCVFGVDLETGTEDWHGRPCHGANTSTGTLADGRLYLEYGGYFSALDATGRVTWATRTDAQGSPAIDGDTAFVATVLTVEAIDLTAAAREWPWEDPDDDEPPHADRDAAIRWSVPPQSSVTGPRMLRSPAVNGETIYVTAERDDRPGGALRALERTTGEERWSVASPPDREPGEPPSNAPDPVGRPVPPVIADDLVIMSLGNRRVRAVTPDGKPVWRRAFDHEVTGLAAGGRTLIALTHDRSVETVAANHAALRAFDLQTGDPLWTRRFPDHLTGVAVAGGSVYVTAITERDDEGDIAGMRLLALD